MRDCGGEKVLSKILMGLSGTYSSEPEWKDRFSKEWTFRKEDPKSNRPREEFTHGRGITISPISILENVEKDSSGVVPEEFRVKYTFDQKMDPTCIVLHYTAISDFKQSLKVLEDRRVSANIMVDKNGKAYQLLDSLNHTARAAGGTNSACIQIEIIGKNTEELLNNEVQTQKVIALVKEISKIFNIPINNEKIESLKGVYSHTQAKKKFGRSVALIGKDFDPGEEYMKKVIEATGSKYYSEEEWYGRTGEDWIILYGDFQP
jgi:N-acetylmuramoyl-L-alanine amidase